jgi:hypothetical protein
VRLVRQWRDLVGRLPEGWVDAEVRFHPRDSGHLDRATALLAPVQPVRSPDSSLSFRVASDGSGPSPAMAERLFDRVGLEKIAGTIELASSTRAEPTAAAALPPAHLPAMSLPESWDASLATLPADWSDLLGEVELASSDYLERAALLTAPLNPRRDGDRMALQFRCARVAGYGASPGMVRRCLKRCTGDGIEGRAHVLRVLSDTRPVQTQGPVWQIAGKTV